MNLKMKSSEYIECKDFPCSDINKRGYLVPAVDIQPEKIKTVMISEAPPEDRKDYFYEAEESFYLKTTLQAFNDAGVSVSSMQEILDLGFYLTTAVKCAKIQYGVSAVTIKNCSFMLEKELALFPNLEVYLNGRCCDKGF